MKKFALPATALLMTALLSACGGGGTNTQTPNKATRIVTVQDTQAGKDYSFTYETSAAFEATVKPVSELSAIEQQVFAAINVARQQGGRCYNPTTGKVTVNSPVDPLILEANIYKAAKSHARAMAELDFATHINPYDKANETSAKRMVNAGYKPLPTLDGTQFPYFEESLAFGFMEPNEVVNAWAERDEYQSYEHCMTLFAPLTYGAVAVEDAVSSNNKYKRYWVLNVSGIRADN